MMKNTASANTSSKRLLFRRKYLIILVISITFVFLALFNLGSYWFINQIGRFLEQGLDTRLITTAQMAKERLELSLNDLYNASEQTLLSMSLERIRRQNALEAAYIINANLDVLIDSRPELVSVSRGYLLEDSTALKKIELDEIATSPLHLFKDNYFKNAYAPLYDFYGNTGILVLEADATSFNTIRFFRRGMYLGSIISVLMLGLIVFFVWWATRLLVRTEADLQQSQRLAVMGQMAATVAHEIRNPLGIIKSTSDVIRERYQDTNEPDEMFDFINEEIGRLNRLVNDFLSFAREPVLYMADHEIGPILNEAAASFRTKEGGTAQIDLQVPEQPFTVRCDRDTIHRVLLNLLINAYQAAKDNNAHITLALHRESSRGKAYAAIHVRDNGKGIQGEPAAIFDPFFTTKTRGTGLGLAVCKNIIERHGGKISARNNPDTGATVSFTLPLK